MIEISNLERGLFSNSSVIIAEYANNLRFFVPERLFIQALGSGSLYDRFIVFPEELQGMD